MSSPVERSVPMFLASRSCIHALFCRIHAAIGGPAARWSARRASRRPVVAKVSTLGGLPAVRRSAVFPRSSHPDFCPLPTPPLHRPTRAPEAGRAARRCAPPASAGETPAKTLKRRAAWPAHRVRGAASRAHGAQQPAPHWVSSPVLTAIPGGPSPALAANPLCRAVARLAVFRPAPSPPPGHQLPPSWC